jgi:hypothetical protein
MDNMRWSSSSVWKNKFILCVGDTNLDLTVYASKTPTQWTLWKLGTNPAMMLAQLLASMKDDDGRVTIKGFYDDVIPLGPSRNSFIKCAFC